MEDIRELAIRDPVAAYGIWRGVSRVPFVFNLTGYFPTLSVGAGQPIVASSPYGAIAQRVWISNISYTVSAPNVLANNVFKTEFDAKLKKNPGIACQLQLLGGPASDLSSDYVPLENLTNLIRADRWPSGFPLFKSQIIQGTFVLFQAPGGHPSNLGPYGFTLTFNGWQFLDEFTDSIDPKRAADELRKAGVLEYCDVVVDPSIDLVDTVKDLGESTT